MDSSCLDIDRLQEASEVRLPSGGIAPDLDDHHTDTAQFDS